MVEAREKTEGFSNNKNCRFEDHRQKVFRTARKSRKCIVDSCIKDHPLWTCKIFKGLPEHRKQGLIMYSGRCFRCLSAGHRRRNCTNPRYIARNPGQNGGQACALHATMAPEQHKKCMGKYSFSIITMS